jgi:hypothetical protein
MEERMTVLMAELAEAEKEQSAKRALRRSQAGQEAQAARFEGGSKSITDFLQEYEPAPATGGGRAREPENEHTK